MALSGDGEGGAIHTVELYRKVRLACREGMSERATARHLWISRESVRKMLQFSVPPRYRHTAQVRRCRARCSMTTTGAWFRGFCRTGRAAERGCSAAFCRIT